MTYAADVIVYATGFRHTEVLWPMTITGRDGIDLRSMWGQRPYAYLGITVPGFPNFFMLYGPGAHLAHGGSLIFNSELQMRYINSCLARIAEQNLHSLEPTAEAASAWHLRTQQEITKMVWSHPAVKHSYFKTPTVRSTRSAHGDSASTGPRCVSRSGLISSRGEKADMRAVIIDAPGSIRVDRRPDPGLTGPDGAIVAVNATGICGSDLHFTKANIR